MLAYNIHHGEDMDEQLDLARVAALISEVDPDLDHRPLLVDILYRDRVRDEGPSTVGAGGADTSNRSSEKEGRTDEIPTAGSCSGPRIG
jgi:hypothetical protein